MKFITKNSKAFDELVEKIDEYMYYYNNERYQWSRNKMTPVQYRSHLLIVSLATLFYIV